MSSEVFLNGNVAFLLPFLIVYPTVKKFSIYIRNFLKKPIFLYRCPENDALPMHYGVEEITINVRKMLKKFYWTYLLIWRSLKVALNRSIISK
jgi:hypothetical protein